MNLVNLSTNILPNFRLKRINKIKEKNKRNIVITTQLIEAGVDISVDIVYRDMAPLDCIIQTAGRCNRNNEKQKGDIYVVLLKDKNGKNFCSYIYDPFLIDVTHEVIQSFGKTVSEKDFVTAATEKYYRLIKTRSTKRESKNLLDDIRKLNFADINQFELIERLPAVSIFIEINKNAEKTRAAIENILSLKQRFVRREKLLEIRKEINENTVNVKYSGKKEIISSLPLLADEHFRYVPRTEINKWYKLDTGFYFPTEEDVKII
jgi:CRISPR-associated endonuclease/helicase Cas3